MSCSWDKSLIAENCSEFKPYMPIMSMRVTANNCGNCENYMNGKCTKELFENIGEIIKLN